MRSPAPDLGECSSYSFQCTQVIVRLLLNCPSECPYWYAYKRIKLVFLGGDNGELSIIPQKSSLTDWVEPVLECTPREKASHPRLGGGSKPVVSCDDHEGTHGGHEEEHHPSENFVQNLCIHHKCAEDGCPEKSGEAYELASGYWRGYRSS